MSTTPDHDDAPETEATAEDDLVRSVLSDAQDLLGEEPPAAPTSIESMLEEVERLTSSLRSSSEEGSPEGSAPASTARSWRKILAPASTAPRWARCGAYRTRTETVC